MIQISNKHLFLLTMILTVLFTLQVDPMDAYAEKAQNQRLQKFQKYMLQRLKSLEADALRKDRKLKTLTAQIHALQIQKKSMVRRSKYFTKQIKALQVQNKQLEQKQRTDVDRVHLRLTRGLHKSQVLYTSCSPKNWEVKAKGVKGHNGYTKIMCSTQLTPPTRGIIVAQLTGFGRIDAGNSPGCRYAIRFNGERKTALIPGESWFGARAIGSFSPVSALSSIRTLRVTKKKRQTIAIHIQPMFGTACMAGAVRLHVLFFPTPHVERNSP